MHIRYLNAGDAEVYKPLRLQALLDHPESFLSSHEEEKDRPIEMTRSRLVRTEEQFTLGGFNDHDELIGMVTFVRESRAKIRHKGNVFAMYVSSEVRQQRLGYTLMSELIQEAKQCQGLEILNLTVTANNLPAKRLYESLGFVCYGTEPNAVKIGGSYLNEDLMSLSLN